MLRKKSRNTFRFQSCTTENYGKELWKILPLIMTIARGLWLRGFTTKLHGELRENWHYKQVSNCMGWMQIIKNYLTGKNFVNIIAFVNNDSITSDSAGKSRDSWVVLCTQFSCWFSVELERRVASAIDLYTGIKSSADHPTIAQIFRLQWNIDGPDWLLNLTKDSAEQTASTADQPARPAIGRQLHGYSRHYIGRRQWTFDIVM